MNTTKKAPQRTCVACRTIGGKRGLLRVVRTPEGRVVLDPTGRLPGRGTYLCREAACLNAAIKGNQIEHTLKVKLSPGDRENLKNSLGEFIKEHAVV
jgi:predicted RNA-binding protein YlxR (DUF448 family)